MFVQIHKQYLILLLLPVLSGCVPAPNREPTEIKSAADVKISLKNKPQSTAVEASQNSPEAAVPPTATETPVTSAGASMKTASSEGSPAALAVTKAETKVESNYTGPPKFFGRITVTGVVPELAPLLAQGGATKDPVCAENAVPNESIVRSTDGGLANVFVYLKKGPASGVPEPSGAPVEIDQKGCIFLPHAQIVRVGQTTTLKNSDPVAHNVNIKAFQEAYNNVVPANGSIEHTFRFAERLPASTGCDFHTFMSAWILPLDHPWGAVSDADGRFEITDLPVGTWEFIVWHEKVGYVERTVKIEATLNSAVERNFQIPAAKLAQ